jgi:hypothetical protein
MQFHARGRGDWAAQDKGWDLSVVLQRLDGIRVQIFDVCGELVKGPGGGVLHYHRFVVSQVSSHSLSLSLSRVIFSRFFSLLLCAEGNTCKCGFVFVFVCKASWFVSQDADCCGEGGDRLAAGNEHEGQGIHVVFGCEENRVHFVGAGCTIELCDERQKILSVAVSWDGKRRGVHPMREVSVNNLCGKLELSHSLDVKRLAAVRVSGSRGKFGCVVEFATRGIFLPRVFLRVNRRASLLLNCWCVCCCIMGVICLAFFCSGFLGSQGRRADRVGARRMVLCGNCCCRFFKCTRACRNGI